MQKRTNFGYSSLRYSRNGLKFGFLEGGGLVHRPIIDLSQVTIAVNDSPEERLVSPAHGHASAWYFPDIGSRLHFPQGKGLSLLVREGELIVFHFLCSGTFKI